MVARRNNANTSILGILPALWISRHASQIFDKARRRRLRCTKTEEFDARVRLEFRERTRARYTREGIFPLISRLINFPLTKSYHTASRLGPAQPFQGENFHGFWPGGKEGKTYTFICNRSSALYSKWLINHGAAECNGTWSSILTGWFRASLIRLPFLGHDIYIYIYIYVPFYLPFFGNSPLYSLGVLRY